MAELIIAMAIVAILTAIAVPDIPIISSRYRLKEAAREVETDLQLTRFLAVKENKNYQVVFGPHSYQVIRLSDGIVAKTRSFGTDYPDINLTTVSITFDPRGLSNGSTVTVANAGGARSVTVAPTGRVMLQ